MTLLQTQDINPLTGDVGLNPAAWGLSMKDINSAASVSLKSSIYAGNVNLTADQYREVETLVLDKYSAIDSTGIIAPGGITKNGDLAPAIDMTGKDSGLYMSNDRLGFYDGTAWQVWMGNNGDFFFGGDANNYISWDGTSFIIRGSLQMPGGGSINTILDNAILKTELPGVYDEGTNKFRQWLSTPDLGAYTVPSNYTGIFLDSTGLYGKKNGINQFSISSSTGDAMFRGIIYASGGEFDGNINSTAIITGGSFRTYDVGTGRYSEVSPGKLSLQNNSGIDIVSITGSNFRYINADATISSNTHHSFQSTASSIAGFGSSIGLDFGTYNDSTDTFSSYGTQLWFNYNSPSSVDALTQNEIRNSTAPNYTVIGPLMMFKGYTHIPYLINASFIGRMKIPVGTNLY